MKSTIASILLLLPALLALECAAAVDMDSTCNSNGFLYGVGDWKYANSTWTQVNGTAGFSTLVNGTSSTAYWFAEPAVNGIVGGASVYDGGTSGMLKVGVNRNSSVTHITLCSDALIQDPFPSNSTDINSTGNSSENETGAPPSSDVPEFGTVAAALVALAGIGIVAYRKR